MKRALVFLVAFMISQLAYSFPRVPNPDLSPGHLCTPADPDFEKFRYNGRVAYCKRKVSSSLKEDIKRSYGIKAPDFDKYVVDHVIPLSIGGSNRPENLWPQHKCIRRSQLKWEQTLYRHVKNGRFAQNEAVEFIFNTKFNDSAPLSDCD